MITKKYTLYFKGKNKYGHEHDLPIVSLDLKSMDEYTSNYKSYDDLFIITDGSAGVPFCHLRRCYGRRRILPDS